MPTLENIKEQLGMLDFIDKTFLSGEINALCDILTEAEHIEHAARGCVLISTGLVVATNNRIIFVYKTFGKLRIDDQSYKSITSIKSESGFITGSIVIISVNSTLKIKKIKKDQFNPLVDIIRKHLDQANSPPPDISSEDDSISKLERLGKLLEQGLLTEEEFQDQKQRLLSKERE